MSTPIPLALFRELASSARPAGGAAEETARLRCAAVLANCGFHTMKRPFQYSAWPGLYGTPFAGLLLVLSALWIARGMGGGSTLQSYHLWAGFAVLPAVAVCGRWLVGRGVLSLPFLRRDGVNLEATRGNTAPLVWLVAHIDSKSQSIPMLIRILGVLLCSLSWMAMLLLWIVTFPLHNAVPNGLFTVLAITATIGATPLALCFTGSRGDGALDNASGVVTILKAIELIDPQVPLGVLITSAEELGLAGARAWVRARPRATAINCDSVDDVGQLVCMLPRTGFTSLGYAVARTAKETGIFPAVRGIIPGVLVDAIPFTEAGWPALTISRGKWRSLARIHTRRDTLAEMDGGGIVEAARFVAALAGVIIAKGSSDIGSVEAALYGD